MRDAQATLSSNPYVTSPRRGSVGHNAASPSARTPEAPLASLSEQRTPGAEAASAAALSPLGATRKSIYYNEAYIIQGASSAQISKKEGNGVVGSSTGDAPAPAAPVSINISVICRVRPSTRLSAADESRRHLLIKNQSIDVAVEFDTKTFNFNRVHGPQSSQQEVFEETVDIIDSILQGYNGSIIAYGQTSAGKTWTMEGDSNWNHITQGIIPRSVHYIYERMSAKRQEDNNNIFEVIVSYYEIYNEKINDLLKPDNISLKIRETKKKGWEVKDISEVICETREQVLSVIERGKGNRKTSATFMNVASSRSHRVLQLTVLQKHVLTKVVKRGRLYLVDLAGSEKVSKTGAQGTRLEEAKNINSSLSTFGLVICALSAGSSHVPYRDSKLTCLLKESIGGNSKTALVICCAPEMVHLSETVSTLRFGERAKRIKMEARMNSSVEMGDGIEVRAQLLLAHEEIRVLRERIAFLERASMDAAGAGQGSGQWDDEEDDNDNEDEDEEDDDDDDNEEEEEDFPAAGSSSSRGPRKGSLVGFSDFSKESYADMILWFESEAGLDKVASITLADQLRNMHIYIIPQLIVRLLRDPTLLIDVARIDRHTDRKIKEALDKWKLKSNRSTASEADFSLTSAIDMGGAAFADAGAAIASTGQEVIGNIGAAAESVFSGFGSIFTFSPPPTPDPRADHASEALSGKKKKLSKKQQKAIASANRTVSK